MATFRDKKNREWVLDLDVYLVEQIHKRIDAVRIDRLLGDEAKGLGELFGDAVLFVRVLWVMVREQAEKKSTTPEDFGRALGGDALEAAGTAFVQALADFSPRRQRTVLKAMLARGEELQDAKTAEVLEAIEKLGREPSTPATPAAESSASSPAPAG